MRFSVLLGSAVLAIGSCQSAVQFNVRSMAQEDLGCPEVEIEEVTGRVAGNRPNVEYQQRYMLARGCEKQMLYECRGSEGEAYQSRSEGHPGSPRGMTTGPWRCWALGETFPDERSVEEEKIPRP